MLAAKVTADEALAALVCAVVAPASLAGGVQPDPDNPGDRRAHVLAKVRFALAWWNDRSPASP